MKKGKKVVTRTKANGEVRREKMQSLLLWLWELPPIPSSVCVDKEVKTNRNGNSISCQRHKKPLEGMFPLGVETPSCHTPHPPLQSFAAFHTPG